MQTQHRHLEARPYGAGIFGQVKAVLPVQAIEALPEEVHYVQSIRDIAEAFWSSVLGVD
jgi:hypothetical protein